jgi:hypothetical protein
VGSLKCRVDNPVRQILFVWTDRTVRPTECNGYSGCSVLFHAARKRSEETMRFNIFDNAILGAIHQGQAIAVEGTHRPALRVLVASLARRLSLRLGAWRALSMKRTPAGSPRRLACGEMTPAMATCPSYSGSRFQRSQRWMSGVVVDPGTVGVC